MNTQDTAKSYVRQWLKDNQTTAHAFSRKIGMGKNYIGNLLSREYEIYDAWVFLDQFVHFPDGLLEQIKKGRKHKFSPPNAGPRPRKEGPRSALDFSALKAANPGTRAWA